MQQSRTQSNTWAVRATVAALVLAAGSTAAHAQCSGYSITSSSGGTIVPGITSIGNAGDDVTNAINLPFPVSFYGTAYTTATASSNGNLQFGGNSTAYSNGCIPNTGIGRSLLIHWDDLRTDGAGNGIFTSVTGTAPNRVFNIEWRALYYNANTTSLNFQIRLYEDNSRIEYVYGAVPQGGTGATVGIQSSGTVGAQFSCDGDTLTAGTVITIAPQNNSTNLCPTGGANPGAIANCTSATTLLTVNVPPASDPASTGIAVTGNLTQIGGSATQVFYNDGTNGDVTAGDTVYSYRATIPTTQAPGTKTINFSATDQQGRTGTGSFTITINCVNPPSPILGPDVYTFAITDVPRWGTSNGGAITAYSVGTTSNNQGDYPVLWIDSNNYLPDYDSSCHPVISQNMYRAKKYGTAPNEYWRFEQLGQSWLKHGFVSTNSNCTPNTAIWRPSLQNYQSIGGDVLAVNCTDTYGGGLNGSQGYLGAKNIVDATKGSSPFVRGNSIAGTTGNADTRGRLQVPTADVTGQPAGTRFFVDAYYVTADDSQFVRPGETIATNALNNASWTEVTAASVNSSPALTGGTRLRNPGLLAWQLVDPTVTIVTTDHDDTPNPGTGFRDANGNPSFPNTFIRSRYWVGAKATSLGNGLYRYEYAVYNHNSDRSANSFTVPMPVGATVTDTFFRAPVWHSGETYSNTPWTTTRSASELTFKGESFAQNANANAIRWGNTFNFGFTANVAPTSASVKLGLFKPGFGATPINSISATVPTLTTPARCGGADIAGQGATLGSDNALDNNDFIVYIDLFFAADSRADYGSQGGVPGADGQFNNNDFIAFIDQFFAGC